MKRFICSAALAWGVACWTCLVSAHAQNPLLANMAASDGISVSGTGELVARPNWVEIDLSVSGKAELTGDALVKYRDAKRRVQDALDKLGLEHLSADEVGLSISAGSSLEQQQRMMNNMPQVAGKNQISVSSVLRVRLKEIRDMAPDELLKTVGRLLDVAQDSGVTIGPSADELMQAMRFGNYNQASMVPVRFVVADLDEFREKAYERAVADARSRGSRLAKLHGVKLGDTLSVQELLVAGDQPGLTQQQIHNPNLRQSVVPDVAEGPRVTSPSLSGIPVQVKLLVRFAIQPADPATAQK